MKEILPQKVGDQSGYQVRELESWPGSPSVTRVTTESLSTSVIFLQMELTLEQRLKKGGKSSSFHIL